MIDFKQVLADNPRFTQFDIVEDLIDEIELKLKNKIEKDPDQRSWCEKYTQNISSSALCELYTYIVKNFVETGKTQMNVVFEHERDFSMHYNPATIIFSVKR